MKCLLLILLLFISRSASAQELLGLVAGWKMDSNCELIDISESSQANGVLVDVSLTVNSDNVPQSALSFISQLFLYHSRLSKQAEAFK